MIDLIGKIKEFMKVSHRSHHVAGGFLVGLVFGFGAVVCVAGALEFKDVQHDRLNTRIGLKFKRWIWRAWDWVDFFCTVAGGLLGSVLRWMAIGWFI